MQKKSIISSSLGNILEWYDFGLFAVYSPIFSRLFFPSSDPHTALIATFSVFAIGFFCRPIGAILFGYLGDRHGRAKTLRLSVLMISIPTLLVGCLPTYQHAGITASIMLLVIRIWQGISIGGEYSGNFIYLGEVAPSKYRSFYTSLAATGANVGILLAMLIGFLMSSMMNQAELNNWGWRIPYLVSGILCIFIYLTRLNIKETEVFEDMKKNHLIVKNPLMFVLRNHWYEVLRTLGLICMGSTFYYFSFIYLPIVLNQNLHFPLLKITHIEIYFIALMIVLVPLAGLLSDRVGRYKMLLINAILISLITIPFYYLLLQNVGWVTLLALSAFMIVSSLEQGTTPAILVENFPLSARYTGISLAYNIGNGFLGGSIPLICTWLAHKTNNSLSPAFYITLCAIITLSFALTLQQKARSANVNYIESVTN
jgi:MHS family proline/betaine transporter-like MFS transporter